MKIILTRHWETEETKAWILQWHLPWKLTEYGKSQANKLALELRNEVIDIIFSSDLARSFDTASLVHKYQNNIPLITTELLREKSFWIFEWKNKNEIGFYDSDKKEIFDNPPKWENIQDICNRANIFLKNIFEKYFGKTILIVSHDDIWKALVSVITWRDFHEIDSMKKTSITIFELDKNMNYKIEKYSYINHLNN